MADSEANPVEQPIMPWQQKYEDKPNQAVSVVGEAIESAKSAYNKLSQGVMPWDSKWKEKPRVEAPRVLPEPAVVSPIDSVVNKIANVESGGDPNAKNPKSTATGLGQFTASTWKQAVAEAGRDYSLADRKDPEKAKEILKSFTSKNAALAEQELGRKPQPLDLYMYHLLGRGAAGDFLKAPPEALATDYVSGAAARANPTIFYNKGKPATVASVLAKFKGKF